MNLSYYFTTTFHNEFDFAQFLQLSSTVPCHLSLAMVRTRNTAACQAQGNGPLKKQKWSHGISFHLKERVIFHHTMSTIYIYIQYMDTISVRQMSMFTLGRVLYMYLAHISSSSNLLHTPTWGTFSTELMEPLHRWKQYVGERCLFRLKGNMSLSISSVTGYVHWYSDN